MNRGLCKFYGDLDKAVEAVQEAAMCIPEHDGRVSMLKIADHPIVALTVRCEKYHREGMQEVRVHYW